MITPMDANIVTTLQDTLKYRANLRLFDPINAFQVVFRASCNKEKRALQTLAFAHVHYKIIGIRWIIFRIVHQPAFQPKKGKTQVAPLYNIA